MLPDALRRHGCMSSVLTCELHASASWSGIVCSPETRAASGVCSSLLGKVADGSDWFIASFASSLDRISLLSSLSFSSAPAVCISIVVLPSSSNSGDLVSLSLSRLATGETGEAFVGLCGRPSSGDSRGVAGFEAEDCCTDDERSAMSEDRPFICDNVSVFSSFENSL